MKKKRTKKEENDFHADPALDERILPPAPDLSIGVEPWAAAEEETRHINHLLIALINRSVEFIIFSLDRQYRYTAFNEKHQLEMRKIWNVEIAAGMNALELMTNPELRAAAQVSFDRALAGETFTEVQHQPDADIYYEFIWNPIRLPSGEVIGLTAFIQDITKQKHASQRIEQSEQRYRLFQKATHIGSWEWDISTDQLTWSDEMYIIFDKDPREFTPSNRAVLDAVLEEDKSISMTAINLALSQGIPFHTEYRITDRAQQIQWVESKGEIIFDEQKQPLRVVGTTQDITERKQGEEILRKSQILLNDTQRIKKVGGWEFDPLTNKVTWTDEVYEIYGVAKDYDPSSADQDIQFYAPQDQRRIAEAFRQAIETGKSYNLELQLINALGQKLWVRTVGQVEHWEGKIIRMFGYIIDITERKQAELKLTEQMDELRRWNAATLGRETRILTLKREVNDLLIKNGQPPRYPSAQTDKPVEEK